MQDANLGAETLRIHGGMIAMDDMLVKGVLEIAGGFVLAGMSADVGVIVAKKNFRFAVGEKAVVANFRVPRRHHAAIGARNLRATESGVHDHELRNHNCGSR